MRPSGGTILGNCATGSPRRQTRPTITVRTAMTIATIGRLMKNFDMAGAGGDLGGGRGSDGLVGLGDDERPLPDLGEPVNDDAVRRRQARLDDGRIPERGAELDRPQVGQVGP